MLIEKVINGIRYILSNEDLKAGDKVFPLIHGRILDTGEYHLHGLNWDSASLNFPDEPHTIRTFDDKSNKMLYAITDFGYSPICVYFKIIKMERQFPNISGLFITHEWVDIKIPENLKGN